ncbi:MAG: glycosyltransferase family 2 protein [Gammaproteobacteria bacterium]|nr:glycosyltransferase family 2 protein [Gammaproteobacteria bacterium]
MSSTPLITTIIPTYRRPKLLQRAIRSVLNQTYPHFQVCIYDNASGDDTAAVVGEIAKGDTRVKYHCHPRNIGAIANFNYGMKQVATPYFSFLSDDNFLLPHFFEDAINTLNRYPEAILFAGQTISVDERGQKFRGSLDRWKPGLIFPPDGLLQIVEKGVPSWESVLFRSEVINSVGPLNPSFKSAIDQDFMMRIAKSHIFYISKKQHAVFSCHDNSWTANRDLSERVSTVKKRMNYWLQDEELPEVVKERIMKALKARLSFVLSNHVYRRCVFGEDTETLATATELMKKEVGLSFRTCRAITAAKVANSNRFMKKLVLTSIHWYRRLKIK